MMLNDNEWWWMVNDGDGECYMIAMMNDDCWMVMYSDDEDGW